MCTFVRTWLGLEYHLFSELIIFKVLEIKAIRLMFYNSFCIKLGKLYVSNLLIFYFDVKSRLVDHEKFPLLCKVKNGA
jgi:hypothetical protein